MEGESYRVIGVVRDGKGANSQVPEGEFGAGFEDLPVWALGEFLLNGGGGIAVCVNG